MNRSLGRGPYGPAAQFFRRPLLMHREAAEELVRVYGLRFAESRFESRPSAFSPAALVTQPRSGSCHELLPGGVALLQIKGPLYDDDVEAWRGYGWGYGGLVRAFKSAVNDGAALSVLLEIDSPGGESSGCFDSARIMAEVAREGGKPVWAYANCFAASAAYAIASAADRIVVNPIGEVGSIGVWTMHIDESKFLEDLGIRITALFAGKKKIDGNWWSPLSKEARADIQKAVDTVYDEFVGTVVELRGMDDRAVRSTEAAMFMGEDALTAGVADEMLAPEELLGALARAGAGGQAVAATTTARTDDMATKQPSGTAPTPPAPKRKVEDESTGQEEQKAQDEEEDDEEEDEEDDDEKKESSRALQERKRIEGILKAPEAKGRDALARHFAFETDLSPKAAIAALKAAAPAKTESPLEKVMKQTPQPEVGDAADPVTESADASDFMIDALAVAEGRKKPKAA